MSRYATVLFVIVTLILLPTLLIAGNPFQTTPVAPVRVDAVQKSATGISASLRFDSPAWQTAGAQQQLAVAEFLMAGAWEEPGMPVVPVVGKLFRIPPRSGVAVEVVDAEYETYSDVDYALYAGEGAYEELVAGQEPVDQWLPGTLAEATEPAVMRVFRVSNLLTYPVQVNPARREVRVYTTLNVDIRFEGEDNHNTIDQWPTRLSRHYLPYYRQLLDWDENELDQYEIYRGSVQVLVRDNNSLMNTLEPWLTWKRQKGWEIELLNDDDAYMGSAYSIKQELEDRWDDAEEKFDYIVVVGDNSGYNFRIPPSDGYGDYNYACLAGNDMLIDCGIGRISIETITELSIYVNKVLDYEKTPYMDETDWYTRGQVAVASNESGIGTVFTSRYQRHVMLNAGYTQVDTAWVAPWGTGNVNNRSINRINDGVSFYGCRGFIDAGLSTNQIENLENDYMTPFVVDVTCYTGTWHSHYAITEAYIRAGTTTIPRGAIGAIGTATGYTKPRFNNVVSGGSSFSMHVQRNPHMGDHFYAAQFYMFQTFNGYDASLADFIEWNNLMGDPTVATWTDVPEELDVDASNTIARGASSYPVHVAIGNQPVAGAWVTFYKEDADGDVEYIERTETDVDGNAVLDTPIDNYGDAVLTITHQNCQPCIIDVSVTNPNSNVQVAEIAVIDDGSQQTQGDGDGEPEAGEIIGLELTLQNMTNAAVSNISVSGVTDDRFLDSHGGEATLVTLGAYQTATANGLVRFRISRDMRDGWRGAITLEISTNNGNQTLPLGIDLEAPDLKLMMVDVSSTPYPGDLETVTVYVRNDGSDDMAASTATLYSLNPWITVSDPEEQYDAISEGNYEFGDFDIEVDEDAFEGFHAPFLLRLESEDGFVDSVSFSLEIGNAGGSDPTGPDAYGYWAFEDEDTGYEQAPVFDWIEINPSEPNNDYNGVELDLDDYGDNQDDAVVVDLPFDIQYYGLEYSELTICSNGWVAMGSQADMPVSRNYRIPAPLGPDAMIAPYWDERILTQGGGVYHYYDQADGRYIVEWFEVRDYLGNNPCTFQVVFYDVEDHPILSGDNEILFQYATLNHTSGSQSGTSADIFWWTTGIENPDQTDGIELCYWHDVPETMHQLTSNTAIRFISIGGEAGMVSGVVYDADTEAPVGGATVILQPDSIPTTTGPAGQYLFQYVADGQYWLSVSADCYESAESQPFTMSGADVTVDVGLLAPAAAIDTDLIEETLTKDGEVTIPVTLTNTGQGLLTYNTRIEFLPPEEDTGQRGPVAVKDNELDELFDPVFVRTLTPVNEYFYGLAWDGSYFWVSSSNPDNSGDPNLLYRFTATGELVSVTNQPVPEQARSPLGFQDLTWDGEYLYGVDNGVLYQMQTSDDDVTVVDSWEIPISSARYLIWDPLEDLFWLGDANTQVRAVNREGITEIEHNRTFTPRGGAWNPNDEEGFHLLFLCRQSGDSTITFVRMNPENGDAEILHELDEPTYGFTPRGGIIEGWWNPLVWVVGTVWDNATNQFLRLWSLGDNIPYLTLENASGELPPDSSSEILVTLNGQGLEDGSVYTTYLVVDHNACNGDDGLIEVTLIIDEDSHAEDGPEQALSWNLADPYPNPFNATLTVPFSLQRPVEVKAALYNLLGQQVASLANRPYAAGGHELVFTGHDLASGIYFLRFQAGPILATRKVLLLK